MNYAYEMKFEKEMEMKLGDLKMANYTVGTSEFIGELKDGGNTVKMRIVLPPQAKIVASFEEKGEWITKFKIVSNSIKEVREVKSNLRWTISDSTELMADYLKDLKEI